jgi:hypothetical protein
MVWPIFHRLGSRFGAIVYMSLRMVYLRVCIDVGTVDLLNFGDGRLEEKVSYRYGIGHGNRLTGIDRPNGLD